MDCHSGACSPVSVVNAWAYLQGAFPNIYKDNKTLIGTATNQIQTSDLINHAFDAGLLRLEREREDPE
jgi:hypothetical protein